MQQRHSRKMRLQSGVCHRTDSASSGRSLHPPWFQDLRSDPCHCQALHDHMFNDQLPPAFACARLCHGIYAVLGGDILASSTQPLQHPNAKSRNQSSVHREKEGHTNLRCVNREWGNAIVGPKYSLGAHNGSHLLRQGDLVIPLASWQISLIDLFICFSVARTQQQENREWCVLTSPSGRRQDACNRLFEPRRTRQRDISWYDVGPLVQCNAPCSKSDAGDWAYLSVDLPGVSCKKECNIIVR